jgi:hypothetical protein
VVGGAWWLRGHVLWPAPEAAFADGGATPWLAWAHPAPTPTVRVRLGGREVLALIDSGAQYSVIHRDLFQAVPGGSVFDMPMVAYGVGGGSQIGRGTTLDIDLPGLAIRDLKAAILDLGPLASDQGLGTPMILGQDVLRQLVLELDPGQRRLRFVARDVYTPAADLVPATVRRRGGLTAQVSVEGATVEAVIDTGASALRALDAETAAAAGLLDGRPAATGASLVLGGVLPARVIEARTVTFADQLYRRVAVGVYDQPPLPGFPGALIGMAAFADRRAAFDLGRGRLHVSRALELTVGRGGGE